MANDENSSTNVALLELLLAWPRMKIRQQMCDQMLYDDDPSQWFQRFALLDAVEPKRRDCHACSADQFIPQIELPNIVKYDHSRHRAPARAVDYNKA